MLRQFNEICEYVLFKITRQPNTTKHYIYVPFTREEVSEEFLNKVNGFKVNAKEEKNFKILYYGEQSLSDLPDYSRIYVIGHGLNISPNRIMSFTEIMNEKVPYDLLRHLPFSDWAYSIFGGKEIISIDTVANRMIEDGLLGSDHIKIKLWFCDPQYNAYERAKRFTDHFSQYENQFTIDYYLHSLLGNPTRNLVPGEITNKAKNLEAEKLVRPSSVRGSLFSKNKNHQMPDDHFKKEIPMIRENKTLSV